MSGERANRNPLFKYHLTSTKIKFISTADLTEFVSKSHELGSQYSEENGILEGFKKL